MYWDNDFGARPEDSVETELPIEQTLPLTPEELQVDNEDSIPHPILVNEDTDDTPEQPEYKTYVDARP